MLAAHLADRLALLVVHARRRSRGRPRSDRPRARTARPDTSTRARITPCGPAGGRSMKSALIRSGTPSSGNGDASAASELALAALLRGLRVGRLSVVGCEVAAARAHPHAGPPGNAHLDLPEAAVARDVRRLVGEQVVHLAVPQDASEAVAEVVRVAHEEAARVLGQRVEALPLRLPAAGVDAVPDARGREHPRALEGGVPSRHLGHHAARVERVEHDARARRGVDDLPDVVGPVLGGPEADEEAVRQQDDGLASREPAEPAHDGLDRRQRAARARHDLEHHAPRLRVRPLARPDLAQVVLVLQDLLDREAQRVHVGAVDQLGLVLAQVGTAAGLDRLIVALHAVDRTVERPPVPGEVLVHAHRAAGRDERDVVVRRALLVDEAAHGLPGRGHAARPRVQVVDGEHEEAALRGAFLSGSLAAASSGDAKDGAAGSVPAARRAGARPRSATAAAACRPRRPGSRPGPGRRAGGRPCR